MNWMMKTALLIWAMGWFGASANASGTIAAVESGNQRGQAVLFPYQGRCLAITAYHVVKDTVAGRVYLPGEGKRVYEFDRFGVSENQDIALLEIRTGSDRSACGNGFFNAISAQSLLNQDNRAQVQVVDGSSIGRIGGTIFKNSPDYTTLRMRPYQSRDPLVEKGISGGVMTIGGNPVAIVTKVENPDTDPVIVATSIGKVRSLFPEYLPSRRRYSKYDISWMPTEFRRAIQSVRRSVQIGLDEAERAEKTASDARSFTQRSRPVPKERSQIQQDTSYHYNCKTGLCESVGATKAFDTENGSWKPNLHGLGIVEFKAGPLLGNFNEGRFVNGQLRLGVVRSGTTPSDPVGATQILGSWNEKGFLRRGRWVRSPDDGRIVIGEFEKLENGAYWLTAGRVIFRDGARFEGRFKNNRATGYCVWWDSEGRYEKGGKCDGNKVIEPVLQP